MCYYVDITIIIKYKQHFWIFHKCGAEVFMARNPDETLEELGGRKKLSPMELEFMKLIWAHPEGISSEEIYRQFSQSRSTKSTVLSLLCKKGYAENRQEGLHHIYTALVTRAAYEKAFVRQQSRELFGRPSLTKLVTAFCGQEELTKEQQERVQHLLKELETDVEDWNALD